MSIKSEIARIKEVRQNKRSDYEKLFNSVKQLVQFAKEVENLRTKIFCGKKLFLLNKKKKTLPPWGAASSRLPRTEPK